MTTPTPAQADEKAPDPITRPIVGIEHRTAQEVFEIMVERVRRAAPEAVAEPAYPELDDGYQWVRNIRASPPAPAGVKVRPLEWLECKALSGFTKLIGRDCFGNEFVRLDIRNQTRAEIDEFKRAQQADYEARILSAILPPEEAQAGSPAEALPSQTSGAEAPETKGPYEPRICKGMPTDCCDYGVVSLSAGREVCRVWREQDARAIAAALAKPASEPAGGGVREAGIAFADQVEVLLSADTDMPTYQQDYDDTEAALETFRAALSSPASSPAEAEALPAGVDAAAICERQALQYLNGEPPTATGRMYQRACRDCAEAIRAAALSPAPAQAGSQKDMSAHPRGSGPGPSSVEATLRAAVQAVTDATSAYLPPDGISKDECINRVLAATDNPEINAVMLGGPNGRS